MSHFKYPCCHSTVIVILTLSFKHVLILLVSVYSDCLVQVCLCDDFHVTACRYCQCCRLLANGRWMKSRSTATIPDYQILCHSYSNAVLGVGLSGPLLKTQSRRVSHCCLVTRTAASFFVGYCHCCYCHRC